MKVVKGAREFSSSQADKMKEPQTTKISSSGQAQLVFLDEEQITMTLSLLESEKNPLLLKKLKLSNYGKHAVAQLIMLTSRLKQVMNNVIAAYPFKALYLYAAKQERLAIDWSRRKNPVSLFHKADRAIH